MLLQMAKIRMLFILAIVQVITALRLEDIQPQPLQLHLTELLTVQMILILPFQAVTHRFFVK